MISFKFDLTVKTLKSSATPQATNSGMPVSTAVLLILSVNPVTTESVGSGIFHHHDTATATVSAEHVDAAGPAPRTRRSSAAAATRARRRNRSMHWPLMINENHCDRSTQPVSLDCGIRSHPCGCPPIRFRCRESGNACSCFLAVMVIHRTPERPPHGADGHQRLLRGLKRRQPR